MRATAVLIIAVSLALVLEAQSQNSGKVWIEKNEVWIETAAGPRQITHDGIPKSLAAPAPSGNRFVYLVDDRLSHVQRDELPREVVVEVGGNGEVLRHITPDGYVPGPFDRLEWIDDHRVGAMTCGHANCMYWILDADSGKTLQVMEGGFDFVWSHNGKCVARRFVAQFDTPLPPDELDELMLNESSVYPPESEVESTWQAWREKIQPTHHLWHGHYFGPFTWSPHDVWLGFTDTVTPEGDPYVVLVSPTGVFLRETLPVDVQFGAAVEWDDDTHLHLLSGGHLFRLVVEGSELHEIAASENK